MFLQKWNENGFFSGIASMCLKRVLSVENTEINPRRTELCNISLFVPPAVCVADAIRGISDFQKMNSRYVNLARIEPSKLEAVSPIFTKDTNKWTLSIKGQTATCVSVVNTVKSSLRHISAANKSKLSTVPLLKYITGVHLSQEFDRVVGVCGMVFHHKGMHAQLNENELTFGTKSTTADKLAEADSRKVRSEPYAAHLPDFPFAVPLYDGRGATINAATDIDILDDILPRYEGNDGEIPNNSCTAVVYTVTQWKKKDEEHITFDIKWAVVLGQPQ
ncbi:hypothetical protein B0H13DRAFT_1863691 [Mycena leptocephala]|nr:hypothetical protein B0H13DRAFT_1913771 [Mycena leptocephala]KAJ7924830.1 hypothetical protein B0H13DRAFT_1863691 [Mycena leptocephala]